MFEAEEERDPLEILAAEFIERQRRGESPSISEYAARHPDLAADIEEIFPTIAVMEQVKAHKERGGAARAFAGRDSPGAPRRLPHSRRDRPRRHGHRLRGIPGIARSARGREGPAPAVAVGSAATAAFPTRGANRRAIAPHQYRSRVRRGRARRVSLYRHATHRRRGPGRRARQAAAGRQPDILCRRGRCRRPFFTTGRTHEPSRCPGRNRGLPPGKGLGGRAIRATARVRHAAPGSSDDLGHSEAEPIAAADQPPSPAGTATEEFAFDRDTKVNGNHQAAQPKFRRLPGADESWQFGPPYWRSVATIGQQVAEALHYAHAHHTLHRDIKPANLLLDSQGVAWITDFGLAKAMEQDNVTQTGAMVGTLRYMAPEQFSGQADARSDIYSLGLTLYELLTLRPAFEANSRSSLIAKIAHGEPPGPRKLNPAIPRDLETIVLKAMAREPRDRYPTAGELARDLECFLEDRPIQARRTSAGRTPVAMGATQPGRGRPGRRVPWCCSSRWPSWRAWATCARRRPTPREDQRRRPKRPRPWPWKRWTASSGSSPRTAPPRLRHRCA